MSNDCKTCPVSTGTHKPAEAVHQIAEPQPEALRLAAWLLHRSMSGIKQNDIEASNQLRWLHAESLQHKQELAASRFTVANREARIAELESQLEAIGAGGVEPLRKPAAAQQACSQSHPHEEMTPMCELRTEIARLTNALARAEAQLAAAPQAVQDAVPLFWVRLLRDGLYEGPVHNNSVGGKMLRDEKPGEWHPLYLHAATAHPAEGVPAQAAELDIDDLIDRLLDAQQDLNLAANVHMDQSIASASTLVDEVEIALRTLAATHPTQQGLDAQRWQIVHDHISGEYIAGRACFVVHVQPMSGANIMRGSVAEHFTKAVDDIAAQAKQGGV